MIEKCGGGPPKKIVVPPLYNDCTFQVIDSWDENEHRKSCDIMYILQDSSGGYVWDQEKQDWLFARFLTKEYVEILVFEKFVENQAAIDKTQNDRLDFLEKSMIGLDTTISGSQAGVTATADVIKTEFIVSGDEMTINSAEIFIHNLQISLEDVSTGNQFKCMVTVPVPEGYQLASDRGEWLAICDSGGNIYVPSFMNYRAITDKPSIISDTMSFEIGFYSNVNYPATSEVIRFRDIRVKLI